LPLASGRVDERFQTTFFIEGTAELRLQMSDLLSQRIVGACPPGVFRRPLFDYCGQAGRFGSRSRQLGFERCHPSGGVLGAWMRGGLETLDRLLQSANLGGG